MSSLPVSMAPGSSIQDQRRKIDRFVAAGNVNHVHSDLRHLKKWRKHHLVVVKKDGSREEFSGEKVLRGLIRACEKRPVSLEDLKNIVYSIEKELRSAGVVEINSDEVGEMVMEQLADVDEVAYVRFASVYRQYQDMTVFIEELQDLQKRTEK